MGADKGGAAEAAKIWSRGLPLAATANVCVINPGHRGSTIGDDRGVPRSRGGGAAAGAIDKPVDRITLWSGPVTVLDEVPVTAQWTVVVHRSRCHDLLYAGAASIDLFSSDTRELSRQSGRRRASHLGGRCAVRDGGPELELTKVTADPDRRRSDVRKRPCGRDRYGFRCRLRIAVVDRDLCRTNSMSERVFHKRKRRTGPAVITGRMFRWP